MGPFPEFEERIARVRGRADFCFLIALLITENKRGKWRGPLDEKPDPLVVKKFAHIAASPGYNFKKEEPLFPRAKLPAFYACGIKIKMCMKGMDMHDILKICLKNRY